MAAYWSTNNATNGWVTMTVTATATTSRNIYYVYEYDISNWADVCEELPPSDQDYLDLRPARRSALAKPQMPIGRCLLAAQPRGKLTRWKSLKEKRQAWGIV